MMSYHSDTLAFRKVELLAVLQAIDSGFNFNVTSSYKNTFFKHDVFDGFEVACLISGYNPNKLTIDLTRSTTWRKENPKFVEALNLVMSVDIEKSGFWQQCDANFYECEHTIKNEDLKTYLASKNIFIDGFNDNLSVQELIGFGQPSIQQIEPNIESLNAEITQLRELIVEKNDEIDKLKKDFEKENQSCFDLFLDKASLEKENAELKEKIKDLENDQSKKIDLLALILDETQTDRYAPDLAYSINFWLDAYINNPKVDSHNNKANTWIKKNTPYSGEQDDTPTRRIREIATPFKDLHQSRKKLLENR